MSPTWSARQHLWNYSRAQVCVLAAMDVEAFKTLRRRGHIEIGWTENSQPSDRNLSPEDAVAVATTAALLDATNTEGVRPATAHRMVRWHQVEIHRALGVNLEDRYIALADDHLAAGTLHEIFDYLSPKNFGQDYAPGRLVLLNLSKVIRSVRARAVEAGIDFPSAEEFDARAKFLLNGEQGQA